MENNEIRTEELYDGDVMENYETSDENDGVRKAVVALAIAGGVAITGLVLKSTGIIDKFAAKRLRKKGYVVEGPEQLTDSEENVVDGEIVEEN